MDAPNTATEICALRRYAEYATEAVVEPGLRKYGDAFLMLDRRHSPGLVLPLYPQICAHAL